MNWTIVTCIAGLIFLAFVMHYIFSKDKYQIHDGGICSGKSLLNKKNVVFAFAHPDDEVMFFSPSIITLLSSDRHNVYLLCLSSGNSEGLGNIRTKELFESGKTLGVKEENIHIVDNINLQDDPKQIWDSGLVAEAVLGFVKKNNIEAIITFDEGGVSGHVNHISVYEGIRYLIEHSEIPKDLVAYKLLTTNMLRKYSSVVDIPYSYWGCEVMFTSSWTDRSKALDAMSKHASQWVWFRKLYMLVSRYMLVNTLAEITSSKPVLLKYLDTTTKNS